VTRHATIAIAVAAAAACLAAPALAAEPIQLKFAFPSPATSWVNTKGVGPWSKRVEEASGGLVEIKLYPGGSIGNFRTVYDRLLNGVADLAFGTFGAVEDQFRKASVSGLPFLTERSTDAGIAMWRLYESGVTADEYARVKPLAQFGFGSTGLHLAKPVAKVDDLAGMKILANGRSAAKIVSLLGAAPLTSNPAELYQGLSRGVADGISFSWAGVNAFKLGEVVRHHIELPFGTTGGYYFMNKDSFAKLPKKAQEAIDRHSGEVLSRIVGTAADEEDDGSRAAVLASGGHVVHDLSSAEVERVKRLLAPLTEEWVKTTPDGPRVLAAYKAELAKLAKR
jgi:TRAP-type C4-dicarboxylate transport system substrate-binding protein